VTQKIDPATIKQQQQEQWSRSAAGWRKHDERLRQTTAPVTRRLLELAAIVPGMRVLDIASGTGEPALPVAAVVGPQGFVLLTDFSQEMLDVARDKAQAQGVTNVDFRRVDGEEVDAEPQSFDAVLCRWGLMFMPEPLRCLRQAHRALRPGGRIALSVWGPPENNPFFTVPMAVLRRYTEVPAPQPGAPGPFAFADSSRLAAALQTAGFTDVAIDGMDVVMAEFDSGEEYWRYTRELSAPIATLFERLPADTQDKVSHEIAEAAVAGRPDGRVVLTGRPLLGYGVK